MIEGILQGMTAGKKVEFQGEQYVLISNTRMQIADGRALFVAVKANDPFPAQTYVIPAPADVHLRGEEG